MANLTKSIIRPRKGDREVYNVVPVKAGSVIYAGALLTRAPAESVVQRASDTLNHVFAGMSVDELDNTSGADGVVNATTPAERSVRASDGELAFPYAGTAPKTGQDALVVDDATVSADATTNNIKCGEFTRPGPYTGWWFVRLDKA